MNNYTCSTLITLSFIAFQAQATPSSATHPAPRYGYHDDSVPASATPVQTTSASVLPFFNAEARARGYDLPEPFGININYMNMRQNINVDSIQFTGLALGSMKLDNMFKIDVGHTRERSKTETLKLDAWMLPFLNVYGLVGHTRGNSVSQIGVGINQPAGQTLKPDSLQDLKFQLNFKGTTYGAGMTLVGGQDNWFTALDTNYTRTHFDILDGSIDAFTFSPRVGYRFTTPSFDLLHLPSGKLNLWVGSMYQDVQQEFKGSLKDLNMPSEMLQQLVSLANKSGNGRFDVRQHLQTPWNVLLGAQYEITRHFILTTELGFADRNSFFVAGEYRF